MNTTETSFGLVLHELTRLLRRRFDERARSLGFTRAQWQALYSLSRSEGINQAGLAEQLEVENITLCRMIDRLEEAGLVERRPDPADRRVRRLFLTNQARPILDRMQVLAEEIRQEAFAGMAPETRAFLVEGLRQMHDNLSSRTIEAREETVA